MQQVLFWIPNRDGFPIYGFGTMLFIVLVVTTWLAGSRAQQYAPPTADEKQRKTLAERVRDLVLWTFLGGIVGARIFYLIQYGSANPLIEFFQFWNGGIVFYGSAIGGTIAALLGRRYLLKPFNISAWQLADMFAPSIAIGLCLGRIGCFLNGCCWGHASCPSDPQVHFPLLTSPARGMLHDLQTFPGFAMDPTAKDDRTVGPIEPGSAADASSLRSGDVIVAIDGRMIAGFNEICSAFGEGWPRGKKDVTLTILRGKEEIVLPAFVPRTIGLVPTQLYESLSMALIFAILIFLYPIRQYDGQVMIVLMLCYAVHRYFNESLRFDTPTYFLGLTVSQEISILIFAAGVLLGAYRRRFPIVRP